MRTTIHLAAHTFVDPRPTAIILAVLGLNVLVKVLLALTSSLEVCDRCTHIDRHIVWRPLLERHDSKEQNTKTNRELCLV
jgi:hypothetical protein